jgi:tight adherence protein B
VVVTVIALALLCGGLVGLGLLVGWSAWHDEPSESRTSSKFDGRVLVRLAAAVVAGALVGFATGWPVAALAAALAGWLMAASYKTGGRQVRREIERIESLATWAEMLRDTLVAGQGITETIRSTATVAPLPIRTQVQTLARRVQHQRLTSALRDWADEMDDPTADLIASVLMLAATRSGRDVGHLLTAMADLARDRVAMRLRVDARRASTRSEARSLVGFSLAFFGFLTFFSGGYVRPFGTVGGQVVLFIVAAFAGSGVWWLNRLGRFVAAPRVLRFGDDL